MAVVLEDQEAVLLKMLELEMMKVKVLLDKEMMAEITIQLAAEAAEELVPLVLMEELLLEEMEELVKFLVLQDLL
jgi:hypothetical protein